MTRPFGAPPDPFELDIQRRLTTSQRVRLTTVAALVVVAGVLVALALTLFSSTVYTARTEIYYHLRVENATYFLRTDANLADQVLLLTDHSVLGPVAAAHGLTVDQLAQQVSATIVDNSELIRLDVHTPDRDSGVTLANAIAQQYLTAVAKLSPTVAIQQQIDTARASLATASGAEATALQNRIATLQGQIDMANTARNTASIAVPAYSVSDPYSPDRSLAARVGGLIGAVAAAIVCLVLFRRWTAQNMRRAQERMAALAGMTRPPAPNPSR